LSPLSVIDASESYEDLMLAGRFIASGASIGLLSVSRRRYNMDFTTILLVMKAVSFALMIGSMAPPIPPPQPPVPIVQEVYGPVLVYKD